tara:strand:+ start:251 stop:673 length:423 start_codon:yes stop_codon:yes gene_type:complete
MKRIKGKKEPSDTELIIKNPKAVRVNLIHMVRRDTLAIFLVVIATRNPRAVNQNYTHTESRVMGKVPIPTRVAMVTATRNPKAANQNHIHTENRVMGKVPIPTRVAMESLMVTKKVHTEAMEDMATVLLNTLCIIKTNWV